MRLALAASLLCAAIFPSAYLAWQARDVPHLGYFHDGALYYVSAKSLAGGAGYRIASLPGEPPQTKYPPLYPALLAGVWRLSPNSPENLKWALAASWLMLVLWLVAALRAFRDLLGPGLEAWALTAALALNPFAVLCGISLLSELPFAFLLLVSMTMAERAGGQGRGVWLAAAAGVIASAAFLTRTAGWPLLAAGPAAFLLRRQPRRAAAFALAMLPGVAGWMLWVQWRRVPSADPILLYYTDYLGYWVQDLASAGVPRMIWKNLDSLLSAIGSLFVFGLGDSFAAKSAARVLAVAALAGTVRLARRGRGLVFFLFTGAYLAMLPAWNYSPDHRFLVPIFPILLAGFWMEFRRVAGKVRAAFVAGRTAERAAAGAIGAALAAIVLAAASGACLGLFRALPRFLEEHRAAREAHLPAYRWAAANLPRDAAALAYDDPGFYLHTGRKACRLMIPPSLVYNGDRGALERFLAGAPDWARARGLSFLLLRRGDFHAELPEADRRVAYRVLSSHPRLRKVYARDGMLISRIE